jgi:hypothetical protein
MIKNFVRKISNFIPSVQLILRKPPTSVSLSEILFIFLIMSSDYKVTWPLYLLFGTFTHIYFIGIKKHCNEGAVS